MTRKPIALVIVVGGGNQLRGRGEMILLFGDGDEEANSLREEETRSEEEGR